MPVLNATDKFYVGEQPVDKIYAGTDLVWQSGLVINPGNRPDRAIDWVNDKAYDVAGTLLGTAASLVTTTRAGTAYVDDLAGNWTSVAANTARISNKGLLVEEQRINSIRNNSMQGAVPGTPGTPPTNWVTPAGTGITAQLVGTGTEKGVDYIDYRLSGTTGSTFGQIVLEANTAIAAVNAQVWTSSVFVSLVGGSLTNVTSVLWSLSQRDAGGAGLTTITAIANFIGSVTSTLTRFIGTATLNNASTAFVLPIMGFGWASGVAVDFTLRIGWPQLELGAFVTSPIRTTSAAVTRARDLVSLTSPPALGTVGTMFWTGVKETAPTTNCFALTFSNSSVAQEIASFITTSGGGGVNCGGTGISALSFSGAVAVNVLQRVAYGWDGTGVGASHNGVAPATVSTPPTAAGMNNVRFGSRGDGTFQFGGYIKQSAYWASQRVPNAQLQSMTV